MKLNNGEIVIRKSRANHIKPLEGVGGKLLLTNKRLIFKSHFFNIQKHEESFHLDDILTIEAKYNDFLSGKMTVYLKNGSVEKFYVPKRKKWVRDIEEAIRKQAR